MGDTAGNVLAEKKKKKRRRRCRRRRSIPLPLQRRCRNDGVVVVVVVAAIVVVAVAGIALLSPLAPVLDNHAAEGFAPGGRATPFRFRRARRTAPAKTTAAAGTTTATRSSEPATAFLLLLLCGASSEKQQHQQQQHRPQSNATTNTTTAAGDPSSSFEAADDEDFGSGRAATVSTPPTGRRRRRRPIRRGSAVTAAGDSVVVAADSGISRDRDDGRQQGSAGDVRTEIAANRTRDGTSSDPMTDPTLLSEIRFDNRNDDKCATNALYLSPETRRAVLSGQGGMELERMTSVQARTWGPIRNGTSVVVRSRTGTGKTLAFLLPVVERLVAGPDDDDNDNAASATAVDDDVDENDSRRRHRQTVEHDRKTKIGCLIIAPTRELVQQIADQAEALAQFHRDVSVLGLYGGVKLRRDVRLLEKRIPTILVITPGRLVDHLLEHKTRVRSGSGAGRPFSSLIADTRILVLDEADRLLKGFGRETKQILAFLPRRHLRQTLLFSATLPARFDADFDTILLTDDHVRIDCVERRSLQHESTTSKSLAKATEGVRNQINIGVQQSYVVLPSMDMYIPALVELVMESIERKPKIVVFLPTTRLVRLFFRVFGTLSDGYDDRSNAIPIFEMHSKLSQAARTQTRSRFSRARRGVLLTTDVSARGMFLYFSLYPRDWILGEYSVPFSPLKSLLRDVSSPLLMAFLGLDYPDVDLVIQYGLPLSTDLYLHRLGRTARAGKQGRGLLVVLPFEAWALSSGGIVPRLGLEEDFRMGEAIRRFAYQGGRLDPVRRLVASGQPSLTSCCEAAVLSFIAYYVEHSHRSVKGDDILGSGQLMARSVGMNAFPSLSTRLTDRLTHR